MAEHRTAIVVPGHGAVDSDGTHRISRRCIELVRAAERLAATVEPDTVVFSGWSASGGESEAEQMRDAWRGGEHELVVEPTARNTAENATRTLPLLLARHIESAVIVCTRSHLVRTRMFFGRLYPAHGVAVRYSIARVHPTVRSVVWELGALPFVPIQLHTARSELERTLS